MKLTTTLNRIRACNPCREGWARLLKQMGENFDRDFEFNLLVVLESNGVQDMLWALRATVQDSKKIALQLAIEFAQLVLPFYENEHPSDLRPRAAIDAAKAFHNGEILQEELIQARRAAATAAHAAAAHAAADAAYAVATAAYAAYATTTAAAANAAAYAAYAADTAATAAANAAAHAAHAAAAHAAADAANAKKEMQNKQAEIIKMILE